MNAEFYVYKTQPLHTQLFVTDSGNSVSAENSPVQSWSPPISTQSSVDTMTPVTDQYNNITSRANPVDFLDHYNGYNAQYSTGYYDNNYMTQQQNNMYNMQQPNATSPQQMGAVPLQQQQSMEPYYPLEPYSRVQSVGDIKLATQQFESTRHGVSLSQPDLSTANWNEETKYQVL